MEKNVELLTKITGATDQALKSMESRLSTLTDLEGQFADIQQKFAEAETLKDERERNIRLKIVEAKFEEIQKDAKREEQDLAQAVFGLNAMLESMGDEYNSLTNFSVAEQGLVTKAEQELKEAEERRSRADKKWIFKESAVMNAEVALANAKKKVEQAKTEARRLARQRLLKADIEASLQEFMLRVEKTVAIMERRMQDINAQLQIVSARKIKAFEIKEQAAKALEKLDEDLNQREAGLKREEDLLQTLENGSDEHAAQAKKVSELRADVERIRGGRNTAFVLHQSKDKFANELEIHEKTQLKLRDNQRMWITSLRSDTEERVVTFRSRLEAMKAASDQDIAKTLDDLGAEADLRNAEYMARVGAASDRLRMDKIEKHPKRIADIAAVAAAQAEAIQQIRVREQAAIEHFKKLYGIDPTKSSFFHYQEEEQEKSGSTNLF